MDTKLFSMTISRLLLLFVLVFNMVACKDEATSTDSAAAEYEGESQTTTTDDGASTSDAESETSTTDDTGDNSTPPVSQETGSESSPDTEAPVSDEESSASSPDSEPSPSDSDEGADTPPSLELIGARLVHLVLGDTYTDAGATAFDHEDGDLTSQIITDSNVDTGTAGTYQVSYYVTDFDGNRVEISRIVRVVASQATSGFIPSWESEFELPSQDANGWSRLNPSSDSRLIYVSSSEGNDETAQIYHRQDSEIGGNPFNPSSNIKPFASIDASLEQAREGYPDFILLKRGDVWTTTHSIAVKAGRSSMERSVLSYYGSDIERPTVKPYGINLDDSSFSAVIGIRFSATKRNPISPDFKGLENIGDEQGFRLLGGGGHGIIGHVLIEDCLFEWFANNTIQSSVEDGGPVIKNVVIRRNIIADNYSTSGHSQGIFSSRSSVLLEENLFDHNGWYQRASTGLARADAVATVYNHNTYFTASRNTIFRNNIFARSSCMNNKFTSNTPSGTNEINSWNIQLDNNLYIDGEIGIDLGGNVDQDNGPRWRNIHVTNNVMMHIGRSETNNRNLGWGLIVDDWDSGRVKGNIFTSWGKKPSANTYAIVLKGDTSNVEFSSNIVRNIEGNNALIQFKDGSLHSGITFFNNEIESLNSQQLVHFALGESGSFHNNHYFSSADVLEWFTIGGDELSSLADYRAATGDNTSVAGTRNYIDPDRTIESYLSRIGYATDMDSFVAEAKKQSKYNWREELTASAINAYIRQGFCLDGNDSCQ
jgi:hypothetical protein